MTKPFLSVENLVVDYHVPGGTFRAVDDVSFSVDKGKTIAVVGESGCGKSTVAKALMRLVTPAGGRIVLDGTDLAPLSEAKLRPLRSKFQMVFLAGMFAVHVAAAEALANAVVRRMPDGGRVLLIGSRTSTGFPGKSQYAATKAALLGMGRSWAQELAPRAITVNVLSPGPTDTPMLADPGRAATPPVMPPLGALVDPEDVAALAGFLLGPHGKSITGQNYVVCGGASL